MEIESLDGWRIGSLECGLDGFLLIAFGCDEVDTVLTGLGFVSSWMGSSFVRGAACWAVDERK